MGRLKIGEIFVENGIITKKTLQRALARASAQNRRLGYILEDMGVATGEEIAQALASQFGYKRIRTISEYKMTPELQKLISVDVALRYMLFPLMLENSKLYVATADPTDIKIIDNISKNHNLEIVLFVASRTDIIEAINRNYFAKDSVPSKRRTILVAVRDLDTYAEIESLLSGSGYRLIVANDGILAFKMVLSESPCVVLTEKDLQKMDGYRLVEALNNLHEAKHIPVILLSDGSCLEEELVAYRRGFFEFIKMPIDPISLLTRVLKAVDAFDKSNNYRCNCAE